MEAPQTLRRVLKELATSSGLDASITVLPDGPLLSVRNILHTLGPCGLVGAVDKNMVKLTDEATLWLDTNDPFLLAAIFHSRIKYFGELLAELRDSRLTHDDLRRIAEKKYECSWASLDPLRRRTTWLRALGMMDLSYGNELVITENGVDILDRLKIETPASVVDAIGNDTTAGIEIASASPSIQSLVASMTPECLANRRQVLSYFPKLPSESCIDSLRSLTHHFIPESSRSSFVEYCQSVFGIATSSAKSALSTLVAIGLVQPSARDVFTATIEARDWVASNNDLDLVRLLHCRVIFTGEILQVIDNSPTTLSLAHIAAAEYGMRRPDTTGVQNRIQILREASLIREAGTFQHKITDLGKRFMDELPISSPADAVNEVSIDIEPEVRPESVRSRLRGSEIAQELEDAARNSSESVRLEKCIADAFEFLGVDARHIGGSGNTDVLLELTVKPGELIRVMVDAKTSVKSVTEKMINFDVLDDHKKQHGARYAAIIGPSFSGERTFRWARKHQVRLIETSYISNLVIRHAETPLAPSELIHLFDSERSKEVDRIRSEYEHQRNTVGSVITTIHGELAHPDTEMNGSLSHREVYMALRNSTASPSGKDIAEALAFLSSPLVRGIWKDKEHYFSAEKPTTTATRLRAIADAIEEVYIQDCRE